MQKINFQDLPNTTTPVNATNLNAMQTNVEGAMKNTYTSSTTDTYSCDYENKHFEGITLYEDSTGTTGTITLSDSASNYTYIEIEYCRDGTNFAKSTGKIYNYNEILLDGYFTYYDEGASALVWQIFQEVINILGTSLTRNDTYYTNFFASSYVASGNFSNGIRIKRVIGYK